MSIEKLQSSSLSSSMSMATKADNNRNRNTDTIKICYFNDLHGNTDEISGMANAIRAFKERNTLNQDCVSFVLSGGDNCSGADVNKNKFIFNIMNNFMGVDVSAVGNHETDALSQGMYNGIKDNSNCNCNTVFVATNVKLSENNPLKDRIKTSIVKDGVGFIGAMPQDFKTCTKSEVQKEITVMNFEDTINSLQEEIDKLQQNGINKIVMVSHSGYEMDKEMAKHLSGVDIIIGGHSHDVISEDGANKDNVVMSKNNEPVLITQSGENAKYYGICECTFTPQGTIAKLSNKVYKNPLPKKNMIIEYIKDFIMGKSPKVCNIKEMDDMPKNRKIAPCAWTAFLADTMKSEMNTDIAIINSANIRKVPQVGVLTERDVQESAPMKNNLLITKITEKQLVNALKHSCKQTMTEGKPGLLQGSGFIYTMNKQGDLLELNILGENININNPSDSKEYTACYDSFVAKKDNGEYPDLVPTKEVKEYPFDKDKTAIDYIRKNSLDNLVVKDDGRLTIV